MRLAPSVCHLGPALALVLAACAQGPADPTHGAVRSASVAQGDVYIAQPFATGFFNTAAIGPIGLAFDAQGNLLVGNLWEGMLYRFGPSGGVAGPSTRLTPPAQANSSANWAGLAFTPDGRLYLARQSAGDIVELDPATGTILRTVAQLPLSTGLATDPLSSDLFVSGGPNFSLGLYRISNFARGPGTVTQVSPQLSGLDGLTFAPDGTLYAARFGQQLLRISASDQPFAFSAVANIPSIDGVALGVDPADPRHVLYAIANRNDGIITRVDLTTTPPTLTDIIGGGTRGDFAAVGPDGCLYATQTDRVVKVTKADGTCSLAPTGVLSPAAIVLAPPSAATPVGFADSLTATVNNAFGKPLANVAVTFTVASGPNAGLTGSGTTGADGVARFSYVGQKLGTDTLVATSGKLSSNQALVSWTQAVACPVVAAPPPSPTQLRYGGATAGEYSDPLAVSATLTDGSGAALAQRSVSFTLGTQTVVATTDAAGIAKATLTPLLDPGTRTLHVAYAGEEGYLAAQLDAAIVISRDETVLAYTGPGVADLTAPLQLSGTLREEDGQPVAGRSVTFQVGALAAVSAQTDASGVASAQVTFPAGQATGPLPVALTFAGDVDFVPSQASASLTVYAPSNFVVWGGNAGGLSIGQRLNFWGHSWFKQVTGGDYAATGEFKGYADVVSARGICEAAAKTSGTPLLDTGCWTTKPGNSFPPDSLPAYISAIVATAIAKGPGQVYGNVAATVVLQVDPTPPYGPVPGKPGYGVIAAVVQGGALFPQAPKLLATQTQPSAVLPGQPVPISLDLFNSGGSNATAVAVSETLTGLAASTADGSAAVVTPGAHQAFVFSQAAPAVPPRQASESVTDYQRRLAALDASALAASGSVGYSDANGKPQPPLQVASSSQLQLPRLSLRLSAPPCAGPGTLTYSVAVANSGSAEAREAAVTLTLPDGTTSALALGTLAPGARVVRTVDFTVPAPAPRGASETNTVYVQRIGTKDGTVLAASAALSWKDAAANLYGSIDSEGDALRIGDRRRPPPRRDRRLGLEQAERAWNGDLL